MAECYICHQEIGENTDSCWNTGWDEESLKKHISQIPYGSEINLVGATRCPECHVKEGGFHHNTEWGKPCSIEECPLCRESLFDCDHKKRKIITTV